MAKLYYNMIHAGTWTLEKVPSLWKKQVAQMRAADGE